MEFHDYKAVRHHYRKSGAYDEPRGLDRQSRIGHYLRWITEATKQAPDMNEGERTAVSLKAILESEWELDRCPYYNLYPKVVDAFLRTKLEIPIRELKPPRPVMAIQFPRTGAEILTEGEPYGCCSFLASFDPEKMLLVFCIMTNAVNKEGTTKVTGVVYRPFTSPDDLVEQVVSSKGQVEFKRGIYSQYDEMPEILVDRVARLYTTLCLLNDDPAVITPDVLEADRGKYEMTGDIKYMEKAHKRGKVGWEVGAKIEMSPHIRSPHFALMAVGKGRSDRKLIWRKGAVVHRKLVTDVPTGFAADNENIGTPEESK